MKKMLNLIMVVFIAAWSVLLLGGIQDAVAASSSKSVLNKGDCVKCHADIFQELKDGKSRHKSKVSCIDCHKGKHPPGSPKGTLIPACAMCHKDTAHFALANCINCHQNPHRPFDIFLEGEGQKSACNTCHPDQVTEVNSHKTSHTGFACSFCHKKHRDKPDCLDCHEAHAEEQKFEDCIKCHQAHQPLTLAYDPKVLVNSDCGACHVDIQEVLEAGATKHAKLQCVFCHADKHAVVPDCKQCHKAPHDKKMIRKFESCNDCHQSAHDILD